MIRMRRSIRRYARAPAAGDLDGLPPPRKNRLMPDHDPRSPFDIASALLRARGIVLRRLPGEYVVDFRDGGAGTARFADDIGEALRLGLDMADAEGEAMAQPQCRSMKTDKQYRARFIRRHTKAVRKRALRRARGRA